MGIREIAAADFKTNLEKDGEEVILTSPLNIDYPVKGMVLRTDVTIDPTTGIKMNEPQTSVSIPIDVLPAATTPESFREWFVETTDITGEAITGKVTSPVFDRTLGFVNFVIEVYEEEADG